MADGGEHHEIHGYFFYYCSFFFWPFVHMQTLFFRSNSSFWNSSFLDKDFQKTLLHCVCVCTGNCWVLFFFCLSLLFYVIFYVQHLFVQLYLLNQMQIKGRQNQNRARLNLSSRAFYMCMDKCASTLVLTSHSSVIFKNHATSLSVQTWDVTMPLHHCYCYWTRPETRAARHRRRLLFKTAIINVCCPPLRMTTTKIVCITIF